jgi:NADH-quinone oxidoreductase subunit G
MATIHVDGKTYDVDGSQNLLEACLNLGLDIPYFCWHPALGSVGACRQCAVKQFADEKDTRGRLVMSCMTPANDKTFIAIKDEEAKSFRKSVVEWLMTNHPHDCPVCAEGGHCHLQDMTVMTGHNTRRYRFTKRTHINQDLGPFVNHEMNRCIACYRCVRYYDDYAGGKDLGVFGAHDNVYFGRAESGDLESEFSGNLTEVCPTGVFTDKTHADHYTRKWDMQFAPSVCQNCSVGCNTSPGERYGEIRRVENRYNGAVNHYFLCDRGRFGYGFVNRKDRPIAPRLAASEKTFTIDTALEKAVELLRGAKRVVGIGSPRASLETNFALADLVGKGNFSYGVSAAEQALNALVHKVLSQGNVATPSLRDIEKSDAVFVLGEDITQTAPRVALAVRQAAKTIAVKLAAEKKVPEWNVEPVKNIVRDQKSPVFIASVDATSLDDVAVATSRLSVTNIARLGFAVAQAIDPNSPDVGGLNTEEKARAQEIAKVLLAAEKPLIISGTGLQSQSVIQAAANIAYALKQRGKEVGIALTLLESNSFGTALLNTQGGESVEAILTAVRDGAADVLVVVENDLYQRASADLVNAALKAAKTVLVLDHQQTATADKASFLLPASSFAEGDGTLVNMEGRAQRFFQVFDAAYYNPANLIREGWRWLHAIKAMSQNKSVDWTLLDDVTAQVAKSNSALAAIAAAAPDAKMRIHGLKIAREPHRYSGRTSMRADLSVHEPRTSQDQDSAMAFSMEGVSGATNSSQLIPFAWAPGWNSPQAWNKFQVEVGGHLRSGDSGVRLIEAAASAQYFTQVPAPTSEMHAAPLYHLYGSDEQSSRSDVVATRVPSAYIAVSISDAKNLGLTDGKNAEVISGDSRFTAPVKISAQLATGVIGIPVLAGVPHFGSGVAVSLRGGV